MTEHAPEGWYDDPHAPGGRAKRYWDGSAWTEHVHDTGAEAAITTPSSGSSLKALARWAASHIYLVFLILALGIGGIWGLLTDADRDDTGAVSKGGDVSITDIRAGDCIAKDLSIDVEMSTVEVVPCSSLHYLEAYANFTLPNGDFPGQDEVDRLADGGCVKRFEAFVGVDLGASDLDVSYLRPSSDGWVSGRGVSCLVGTGDATTGTLKDSQR